MSYRKMNQRTQWQNYHIIRHNDLSRDIYLAFNDNSSHSLAEAVFTHPFTLEQQASGRRHIAVGCSQISVPNTAMNISHLNGTSNIMVGQTAVILRSGYYESTQQVQTEINFQLGKDDVSFIHDHLGHVRYTGSETIYVPLYHGDSKLLDHLGAKLGFIIDNDDDVVDINGRAHMAIQPDALASQCGDMFGPVSDCLLTCDQAVFTHETQRVMAVVSLAAFPARSQLQVSRSPRFRPLHDVPYLSQLTFRLVDRLNRHLCFVSGTPTATIELQFL